MRMRNQIKYLDEASELGEPEVTLTDEEVVRLYGVLHHIAEKHNSNEIDEVSSWLMNKVTRQMGDGEELRDEADKLEQQDGTVSKVKDTKSKGRYDHAGR
jgi:hypothetical protein